jgi:hypothetical protein
MNTTSLSLLPDLTRSKMLYINLGTNQPLVNVKYFFEYDLELKESKTTGILFNPFGTQFIRKFAGYICITQADALQNCYINLVDKDNNVVVENMPLNALYRNLYSQGMLTHSVNKAVVIRKFNTEIDWAKSYVIFTSTTSALSGQIIPLTIYYKRKIK